MQLERVVTLERLKRLCVFHLGHAHYQAARRAEVVHSQLVERFDTNSFPDEATVRELLYHGNVPPEYGKRLAKQFTRTMPEHQPS